MELGTGIFLSSLFLGTIGLYVATRDRWNWKKLVLYGGGGLIVLVVAGGLGVWGWSAYENRPKPLDNFWGLAPGMQKSEVKFRKGNALENIKNAPAHLWVYSEKNDKGWYMVSFRDDVVRFIGYHGSPSEGPSLPGLYSWSTPESAVERFGPPSNVSSSPDGLNRIYSFQKYKLFVEFDANGVAGYGAYDPSKGPVTFRFQADSD